MKRLRFAGGVSVVAVLMASGAHGQGTVEPSPSAYCVAGSAGFLLSESKGVSELRQKCRRGDTIVIPAVSAVSIASVCDFSRAVVHAGANVVCVILGYERGRR